LFADPDFDGDPALVTEEELKEYWEAQSVRDTDPEPTTPEPPTEPQPPRVVEPPNPAERRKFYFDGGQVEITAHLVYELDPDGKQLRVIRYTDYAGEKVRTLFPDVKELRKQWSDPAARTKIIESLAERGISFDELAEAAGQPEADPFDLICHLAHNAPLRTRRERAHTLRTDRKDFFGQYSPEARQILEELLEKYAEHGTAQFVLPDVLDVPPISDHGQPGEIVRLFGGAKELREAVTQLQTLLYSA
jgi:type I restriction enzyme R subunit